MTTEQYQEAKQEIHWDVAWQIFDEVNSDLDTVKHIDLNCLSHDDALAITKQKIYDTAQIALNSPNKDFIMHVQCGENHLLMMRDKQTGKAPVKNVILEMLNNELKMDHFHLPDSNAILVRID